MPHSLIKSFGTEVQQFLNEPLLKKGDVTGHMLYEEA
jgi:hypothetical protein